MSVKDLDVNPKYVTALLRGRIHEVKKLLSSSKWEVVKRSGLSENAVKEIFKAAARFVATTIPSSTVLGIANGTAHPAFQLGRVPTHCEQVDEQLGGGVLYPGVTEICGESGSGKTQLAIHVCLASLVDSTSNSCTTGDVLYISTEDAFPTKRLYQMAQHFCGENRKGGDPSTLTDRIYIEHCVDLEDLWTLLDVRLPSLISKVKLKVVVIDSIAALFRTEFDLSDMAERAKMLAKFGRRLYDISWKEKLCVLCINQVSDVFDDNNFKSAMNASDGCRSVTPALGLTWSYYVNTRIMISRTQWKTSMFLSQNKGVQPYDIVVRSLRIMLSSHLPPSKSYFIVEEKGIKEFNFPDNENGEGKRCARGSSCSTTTNGDNSNSSGNLANSNYTNNSVNSNNSNNNNNNNCNNNKNNSFRSNNVYNNNPYNKNENRNTLLQQQQKQAQKRRHEYP